MIILALDPATNTGYCIIEVSKKSANIISYGSFKADTTSPFQGDWCISLMGWVEEIVDEYEVSHVVIEDYFFNRFSAMGGSLNVAFRAAIWIRLRELNLKYTIISISAWKKFITGRTRPEKKQIKKYGKEKAKKIMIAESLYKKWGISLPTYSISEKTGKPINFKYDVSDAIGQGIYFCLLKYPKIKVICSIPLPPDLAEYPSLF
jgi:Holliday junction resolvasome RuvABC endonuclease subunit